MVESKARKAAFLKDAIRILGISGASVETERIEALALSHPLAGSVDVVTVRAVRLDPILFDSVRRLLKRRGRVVLFGVREHFPTPEGFEAAADQPSLPKTSQRFFSKLTTSQSSTDIELICDYGADVPRGTQMRKISLTEGPR